TRAWWPGARSRRTTPISGGTTPPPSHVVRRNRMVIGRRDRGELNRKTPLVSSLPQVFILCVTLAGDFRRTKVAGQHFSKRFFAALSLAISVPCLAVSLTRAQAPDAPDPTDIAAGMRIFRSKAACKNCTGRDG